MRLYVKLLAMILIMVVIQNLPRTRTIAREAWFAVRCELAYRTDDWAAWDRLLEEATLNRWADFQAQQAIVLSNAAGG